MLILFVILQLLTVGWFRFHIGFGISRNGECCTRTRLRFCYFLPAYTLQLLAHFLNSFAVMLAFGLLCHFYSIAASFLVCLCSFASLSRFTPFSHFNCFRCQLRFQAYPSCLRIFHTYFFFTTSALLWKLEFFARYNCCYPVIFPCHCYYFTFFPFAFFLL